MPFRAKNLTDLSVRSLPPGLYFDPKLSSFGIRIGKNCRTWIVVKGPNRTKVRLGHYPALSVAEARRKAHVALGTPYAPQHLPTFPEALEEFLGQEGRWRDSSRAQITRILRKHFPWTKRLDQLTHLDVIAAIEAIEKPSEAAHAFKDIRTFFNWCVPRYLPHSPCTGLKTPYKYVPRDRVLSDKEVKAVWKASLSMGRYGAQVRALIITGQRVGQILALKQQWIDRKARTITFPADTMKGGRAHTIPYGKLMESLFDDLYPVRYQSKYKPILDERSGVHGWVLHDLRRVVASGMASLGIPLHVVEFYLAHRSGSFDGIVSVYQRHNWQKEMRKAVDAWERRLVRLTAR